MTVGLRTVRSFSTGPAFATWAKCPASGSLTGLHRALKSEQPEEFQFTLPDRWQRRLFSALCRRYGLEPYRYKRQRYTTVMVRVPRSFVDKTLWPEYQEFRAALDDYLNDATERIIREEVYRDAEEASERAG